MQHVNEVDSLSKVERARRLLRGRTILASGDDILANRLLKEAILDLDIPHLVEVVDSLKSAEGEARSIGLYRAWIALSGHKGDQLFAAWYNLGVQLFSSGAAAEAAVAFKTASARKPDFHHAAINAGLCQEQVGDPEGALKIWDETLQPDVIRTTLLNHRGRLLEVLKRYDEAEQNLLTSLLTNPDQPDVIHHWIGIRAKTCAWPVFSDAVPGLTPDKLIEATGALSLLALTDDIGRHDRCNAAWINAKMPPVAVRLAPAGGYAHERLRIGYLSSDFCMHPMAYLVADLFEQHDRTGFEIFGYCSTKDDGSPVRDRVVASFDKFTSVIAMSDEQVAQTIRADEIDILIELNGLTLGTRMQALRWRPAPLQITYLGYNGSIPLPEIDYILADRYVIPPSIGTEHRPKPLYLPNCYQVNDRKLDVAAGQTRRDAGLPDDKFVFCCFSNNYKITADIFDAWLDILRRADHTVLWIYADNTWSRRNMAARFVAAGLAEDRLIFAARADPATYRGRLALADLFLDTFPYNAGTTASDALRVGLPIVTISGASFVSRMAGSLLAAMGLLQGIVHSVEDYVDVAVDLATDPVRYAALRRATGGDAWTNSLGDTPAFTRNLERVLRAVAVRAEPEAGVQPHLARQAC